MAVSLKFGWLAALAVGSMLLGCTNMVSAQSGDQVIKERRALMKDNSRTVKAIVGYLKKDQGSAADVGMWARHIAANVAKIPDLYPKGTSMSDGVGKTRAKPEIWMQRVKFEAAAANLSKLAWDLSAAAGTGEKKAIGAVMGSMGKQGCGGCHKTFRGPKQK